MIPDSGGPGRFRGGLGFVREYEVLDNDARFSLRSTKHTVAPKGIDGGMDGKTGLCTLNPGKAEERVIPSRFSDHVLHPGEVFSLQTPGGGGLGNALERDPLESAQRRPQRLRHAEKSTRSLSRRRGRSGRRLRAERSADARIARPKLVAVRLNRLNDWNVLDGLNDFTDQLESPRSPTRSPDMTIDPITLQVIQARLAGIVQEMQNSLFRTGYSTIIRESQDVSCAILNTQRRVVAQHVVLPLHMGAFPACAAAILKNFLPQETEEGDAFIINHPYLGGSPHAPDMGVLTPIFHQGEWVGFAANMAHKSDIGGTVPGSGSGNAREIYQEGLHLPPVKYMTRRQPVKEIEAIIAANSRTAAPGDRRPARSGRRGALGRTAHRRTNGPLRQSPPCMESTELLSDYTENRVRQAIALWPDGDSEGESFVDHDGIDLDRPIRIHVKVIKRGDKLRFDFSASSDQTQGPANIRSLLVRAACAYCVIAPVHRFFPINQGLGPHYRCDLSSRKRRRSAFPGGGEYLYADGTDRRGSRPASACACLFPTGALPAARAALHWCSADPISRATAPSCTMRFSAVAPARAPAKTASRRPRFHLSNCKTAPIEIIESEFPTRVERFEMIAGLRRRRRVARRSGLCARLSHSHRRRALFHAHRQAHDLAFRHRSTACRAARAPASSIPAAVRRPNCVIALRRLPLARRTILSASSGRAAADWATPSSRPVDNVLDDVRQGYVRPTGPGRITGLRSDTAGGEPVIDEGKTKVLRGKS